MSQKKINSERDLWRKVKNEIKRFHGFVLKIGLYLALPTCWGMLLVGPFLP